MAPRLRQSLERLVSHRARRRSRRAGRSAAPHRQPRAFRTRAGRRTARRRRSTRTRIVSSGEIAVVHNGIIENYESAARAAEGARLRVQHADGHARSSRISIHAHWHGAAGAAICCAPCSSRSRNSTARTRSPCISTREPGRVVGARAGQPARRRHRRRTTISSPPTPRRCCRVTRRVVVSRGRRCRRRPARILRDLRCDTAQRVERAIVDVPRRGGAVELGPYRHFMQKEIFEQPRAVADTLEGDRRHRSVAVRRGKRRRSSPRVDRVLILACGTSYYSSLVAKQWIETLARHAVPRSRSPASTGTATAFQPAGALVVVVSQSGETADTLAALKHCEGAWPRIRSAICNVATSSMVRQTAHHVS